MLNDLTIATLIDTFGQAKAATAEAKGVEDSIKGDILALGDGAYEGRLFRVTVTTTERRSTSAEALAKLLAARGVDPALIAQACIDASTMTPTTTVRCVARRSA